MAGDNMAEDNMDLRVCDEGVVKKELQGEICLVKGGEIDINKYPDLSDKADKFINALVGADFSDKNAEKNDERKEAVENMGMDLQEKAARKSAMLKEPVKKLFERSKDGGGVANALIDLKMQVEDLDPGKLDFKAGWIGRIVGKTPFAGNSLKRYFLRYESVQKIIDAIIRSLEDGREQLKRDSGILGQDQKEMREITIKLEKMIYFGRILDQKLEEKLGNLEEKDSNSKFIQEELLFPLRQRTMDLQQQLIVNQQGVITTEIIIRNNKELIRGVNRALNVTVTALEIAVAVALALNDQRIVLDKINVLNTTTDSLISSTAKQLKTQGVEVHKMASSSQLNMNTLRTAFEDTIAAIDDISKFRQEALPKMADAILAMNETTKAIEAKIKNAEEGNRLTPKIVIDLD